MIKKSLAVAAAMLCGLPSLSSAQSISTAALERPHYSQPEEMESYRKALYAQHVICADAATTAMLDTRVAGTCAFIYQSLKLSFLDGVTMERYAAMQGPTRAKANVMGYAAFRAWSHRHKRDH